MAGHNPVVDKVTKKQIREIKPKFVVDVGAGMGYYGNLIRTEFPDCHTIGVEAFGPYVTKYSLTRIYTVLINNDIRNVIKMLRGDLIIFGDVLEHMKKEDALYVLDAAVKNFKYVLINGPKYFEVQHAVNDNKYEMHICSIGKEDCKEYDIIEYNEFDDSMINILIRGKV